MSLCHGHAGKHSGICSEAAETHCGASLHLLCAGSGQTCTWHSSMMMQYQRVDIQSSGLTRDLCWSPKAHTPMNLLGTQVGNSCKQLSTECMSRASCAWSLDSIAKPTDQLPISAEQPALKLMPCGLPDTQCTPAYKQIAIHHCLLTSQCFIVRGV